MVNLTQDNTYFTLSAYVDTGALKYLYFFIILTIYVVIICANVLTVMIICKNRSLHEPMYVFMCSLFINELYGSMGLFPFLMLQVLSHTHIVSKSFCFLQIFTLYSYGVIEFFTLAVMSYDRYVAICFPLQYHARMTFRKVATLISLVWIYPLLLNIFIRGGLTFPLRMCGDMINKVYCDSFKVVKLACGDTSVNNIFGLVHMFTVIFGLLILIIYTYVRILGVCVYGSKQMRSKAVSTCTPHLFSLLNFFCGAFFEVVQSRFDLQNLPNVLRIFLSLYWLTSQPLVSPLLYGFKMAKIRSLYKNLIFGERLKQHEVKKALH